MLAILILTLKCFRQQRAIVNKKFRQLFWWKKTWRHAAGIAKSWKIKMASTFLFVNINPLKVHEKLSGTPKDSIFDIFVVSTIFNDELISSCYFSTIFPFLDHCRCRHIHQVILLVMIDFMPKKNILVPSSGSIAPYLPKS